MLDGAIVLIGNAPLALARIARYALEEGVRPALVVGMPVGFVNVVESKELLAQCDVPQIVLEGRRGDGHDHELLNLNVVGGMRAAVEDVHCLLYTSRCV